MQPTVVNWLLNIKTLDEEELSALQPPPRTEPKTLTSSSERVVDVEPSRPKGLKRMLSARSLNGFLADLIRVADEPAPSNKDALPPNKDKERVAP